MRMIRVALGTATMAAMIAGGPLVAGSAYAGTGHAARAVVSQQHRGPSNPDAEQWQYAGKYYSLSDCQSSGKEGVSQGGADQYRCDEVMEPDGSIAYWNLYLLYFD